eukprot:899156-Pelagomonas_calceolata.AAC.2
MAAQGACIKQCCNEQVLVRLQYESRCPLEVLLVCSASSFGKFLLLFARWELFCGNGLTWTWVKDNGGE